MLHNHLHKLVALTGRKNGRGLETFHKNAPSEMEEPFYVEVLGLGV
jgi:hypothetical protein